MIGFKCRLGGGTMVVMAIGSRTVVVVIIATGAARGRVFVFFDFGSGFIRYPWIRGFESIGHFRCTTRCCGLEEGRRFFFRSSTYFLVCRGGRIRCRSTFRLWRWIGRTLRVRIDSLPLFRSSFRNGLDVCELLNESCI
uniref:Uncharacterized protein n=1 Tax=Lepeophtheirus salmonis TaxID=72036 RepID=A0A0K2SW52_LEPSM